MSKGLKATLIIVGVIVIIGIVLFSFFGGSYNNMLQKEEAVKLQWSEVENQYQRRYDLIPNLVATVKGYASHEEDVLTQVTEARAQVGGMVTISDEILNDPQAFARYQTAQSELGASLQRLLAVSENYPELKANENFLSLQNQLEGTENRIAVARKRYNEVVQSYNVYIKQFPRNLLAGGYGFTEKSYFAADEGASQAPKVSF